jgi:hypothetical protein
MSGKSNGQQDKLKVAGRCLDCFLPAEVEELRGRVDRIEREGIEEIRGRTERLARDRDANAAIMQSMVDRFELLSAAFAGHLKELGEVVGRIGTRKPKTNPMEKL